jgi:hypothetical protein
MRPFVLPFTLALVSTGCSNVDSRKFGTDGSASVDTADADTDTDTDTDSDTDADTDTDTGRDTGGDESAFDEPGDVVDYEDDQGVVRVDLTDASGDSNQGQDFYMVVVNTAESEIGYRLRYYDAAISGGARPAPPTRRARPEPAPVERPARPPASPPPPPLLEADDVGSVRDEFLVRKDLEDTTEYETISATLWALGTNVAIWVDDDVAIDWDVDCDGVLEVEDGRGAYGFDNCDLSDVAAIIDENIIPNVRQLYGEESDIDGDGRVAVVITPVLNRITLGSSNEADHDQVLSSYAEPNVDLADFDATENPGSDEQEVLYVFAPDPYGFFNLNTGPTVEAYTGYQLAAEVARSFTTLVSYNQHHLLLGGGVEEDWVNDVLGTFAAEYCGFGANYHQDAWEYLDAPHRFSLAADAQRGSLSPAPRGAQYLFGLWLYEQAEAQSAGSGASLFSSIVQTEDTGVDAFEGALGGMTFSEAVLRWQVALLTSGVKNVDGDAMVDVTEWIPYPDAATISAPPDSAGGWYGANGYQRGLNVRGINRAYLGGTTDSPTEISSLAVKMENTDVFTYSPGYTFFGWMDANYSAQVVHLTGITYDEALVELQATDTGLVGAVIRWNDPTATTLSVETSYSVTEVNPISLPALPDDGSVIQGLGQLTESATVVSFDEDGNDEEVDIPDTDRWLLDLTDRPASEMVDLAIWLDRQFSSTSGDSGPDDPWIAVAPRELVPEPSVDGTLQEAATCPDGVEFFYPRSLLDHLTAQVFVSSTMTDGNEDDFDACGEPSETATTCADDWDRDGVLDSDEPSPDSFLAQTRVMECTLNGNVEPSAWTVTTDWLDADELDSDDIPTLSYTYNTGGHAGTDGEEAYVALSLEGGREYLIIVGANSDGTGTYELSLRQLD